MRYVKVKKGIFIDRPNRFIAHVAVDGVVETVHVKNTGRCRELLQPGVEVWLDCPTNPNRKTKYDLVTVRKGERLINMDSQAPNKVFAEFARSGGFTEGLTLLKPEQRWGASRFDFYAEAGERKMLIEVKGVTLEEGGVVRFPDAPTERGARHIRELIAAREEGYECYIVFVVQMEHVSHLEPNDLTDPAFAKALREADKAGVKVLAYDCHVTEDTLAIGSAVPVRL